jgi:tRNA (uracil-5-)-methyltransferase TRM9
MEMADQTTHDLEKEEAYEEKHVHEVYQQIAQHFSSTRYKV